MLMYILVTPKEPFRETGNTCIYLNASDY